VEIAISGAVFGGQGCSSTVLQRCECNLVRSGDQTVFRAAGAMLQSESVGRIVMATMQGVVRLNAQATVQITVIQATVGSQNVKNVVTRPVVQFGTGADGLVPARRLLQAPAVLGPARRLMSTPTSEVWGDTDGDGAFTSLDVLFLEAYLLVASLPGRPPVCTVTCQPQEAMTAWQISQLNPLRNPHVPASIGSESDLQLLLMALVGKAFFLTGLDIQAPAGSVQISLALMDYAGTVNPPNALATVILWTNANQGLSFDTPFVLDNSTGTLSVQCMDRGSSLGIASMASSITVDESYVGLQVKLESTSPIGQVVGTFLFMPGSTPVTRFNILESNTTLAPIEVPEYIPLTFCQVMCQSAAGLFLDFTTEDPQWLDSTTVSIRFAIEAPDLQVFPFQPERGPAYTPPANTITLYVPDPHEFFVGDLFSFQFRVPNTSTLGLYQVRGPGLQAVVGADSFAQFFIVQSQSGVNLTFSVVAPGWTTIEVWAVQQMHEKVQLPKPSAPLQTFRVFGRARTLLSLTTKVLCQRVIQWSALGGPDEPCPIELAAVWSDGPAAPAVLVCTSYPCQLSYLGQTLTPSITVLRPTLPQLRVQKTLVARNERAYWQARCTLQGKAVTVNSRALKAGLITVSPANALLVTNGSFSGTGLGMATLTFARNLSVAINVSRAIDPPASLDARMFLQVVFSMGDGVMNASFLPLDPLSGDRAFLLVQASYPGGFSIVLHPSLDQALRITPGANTSISRDGSVVFAQDALGTTSLLVYFTGLSAVVRAQVQPVHPIRLDACCNGTLLSYPGSPALGLDGIRNMFTLTNLTVLLPRQGLVPLNLGDPRVSEFHDVRTLAYAGGTWTVWSSTEVQIGPTVVVITYTQPGSLAQVSARVLIQVVDAKGLLLRAWYPWGGRDGVLNRLHCSSTFQRVDYTAALDLGFATPDITPELQLVVSNRSVLAVSGQHVVGLAAGTVMVTIFGRGFVYAQMLQVLDQSIPVVSLEAPCLASLSGPVGTTLPFNLTGHLITGEAVQRVETVVPVLAFSEDALALSGTHLQFTGNSPFDRASSIRFQLLPCLGFMTATERTLQVRILASPGTTDVQVEPTPDGLSASLAGTSVVAFYLELWTDAPIVGCSPPVPAPEGLWVCNVDWRLGRAVFAGAKGRTYAWASPIGMVQLASPPTWVTGVLEVTDLRLATKQVPVSAGQIGLPPFVPSLAPLPVVDTGSIGRQYLMSLNTGAGMLDAILSSALLLVGRTLTVTPHVYSNDFELTVMLRVTDRFMQPVNDPGLQVTVLFRTSQLTDLLGTNQTADGLLAQARFVQDGWFVLEWTQSIPQLNVSVSYGLCTSSAGGWQSLSSWDMPAAQILGTPLAKCPRGAYAPGVIMVRFHASGNGTLAESRRGLQKIACTLRIAPRRVMLSQDSQGRLSLSVAIESFNRLSEINFAVMDDWFAQTVLPLFNFTPWRLERGGISFINDTADAYRPCPAGAFLTTEGEQAVLPMHATVGQDCYGFTCIDGFQVENGQCIPTSFSSNLVMTVLVVVLSLIVSVSLALCVIQLLCAHRSGDDEVQLDPGDDDGTNPPDPQAADAEVLTEVDLQALGLVTLDPYSKCMLEDQFSPLVGGR
jgi:hypothetical protein